MRNHKGAEKILSVYWFVILFIVAAAIAYMVSSFYGEPYDVREIEADLLVDKIAGCLSSGGYLINNWQNLNTENILAECKLGFNVENTNGWQDDQHFIEIGIFNFNSGQIIKSVSAGNRNLMESCNLDGKTFPVCVEREMYSVDIQNTQYKINILAIVRKTEKNVQ